MSLEGGLEVQREAKLEEIEQVVGVVQVDVSGRALILFCRLFEGSYTGNHSDRKPGKIRQTAL
jgi:hypothetical protein